MMKSPSKENNNQYNHDDDKVRQVVNQQLDDSIHRLDKSTLADIAQARSVALEKMNRQSKQGRYGNLLSRIADRLTIKQSAPWLVPVAAALMIVFSMKSLLIETIPELPLAMMDSALPTEDLALLEDLEFLTWLAKNEMDVAL